MELIDGVLDRAKFHVELLSLGHSSKAMINARFYDDNIEYVSIKQPAYYTAPNGATGTFNIDYTIGEPPCVPASWHFTGDVGQTGTYEKIDETTARYTLWLGADRYPPARFYFEGYDSRDCSYDSSAWDPEQDAIYSPVNKCITMESGAGDSDQEGSLRLYLSTCG